MIAKMKAKRGKPQNGFPPFLSAAHPVISVEVTFETRLDDCHANRIFVEYVHKIRPLRFQFVYFCCNTSDA